ncbi:hypothetical protein QJQ45_015028, partial [Haematococcus lacustris]
ALAASIATTLDATSPATTAETSAGTAAGEQSVTADGIQPVAAMAHLGLKMKGGQHLKASHPPSAQEQPRPAKKRAGRVGQRVAGWGQRAPGAAELHMPDMHAFNKTKAWAVLGQCMSSSAWAAATTGCSACVAVHEQQQQRDV